jgi:hypothetical protein
MGGRLLFCAVALDGAIEHRRCITRYRLSSADPIDRIADFYREQAAAAGIPALGSSAIESPDYGVLIFVRQPRFLSVVLTRRQGHSTARVAYQAQLSSGCS